MPNPVALFNPFLLWTDLALKTGEMLASSGQVIHTRVGRMARAGANPSARDRREFTRMGSEKLKAATQSGLAVATRLQSANLQLAARAWQHWFASLNALSLLLGSRSMGELMLRQNRWLQTLGPSAHAGARLAGDMARLAGAALQPVHSASTANARRLARIKSR